MAEHHTTSTEPTQKPGRLSVVSTSRGGVRVVSLAGEIDYDTGDALQAALTSAGPSGERLVVDLRQVTFLDSTGLNILISAHRQTSGRLRLAAANDTVMRTITIVGVDAVIRCYETLDQALCD